MTQAIVMRHTAPVVGPAATRRPPLLAVGVMIWLGSEFMFFSGLFAAFFTIRASYQGPGPWPPGPTDLDYVQALVFSAILLGSSATMQMGVRAVEAGRRVAAKRWVILTFVMGFLFVANQLYEWITLPFSPSSTVFGSLFFIMSGLHGLHVLLGLAAMLLLLGRMVGLKGDPGEASVFQGLSYYWHFVDFMWIAIFTCLFGFTYFH